MHFGLYADTWKSSTSFLSAFKSWNIIHYWILFIQLYPQRITVSVKTPNTTARDKYLQIYLAKIWRIPNFTHAVLLLHHHFGQNQSINKATRFQMKFFLNLRGKYWDLGFSAGSTSTLKVFMPGRFQEPMVQYFKWETKKIFYYSVSGYQRMFSPLV